MKRIYVVKVKGEYITERGEEKVLRSYKATFRLPNADAPLSTVRRKLLMPFLRKLDPFAVAPVSWHLEEMRPESGDFNPDELGIAFQSKDQLKLYCVKHKLNVPVEEYSDLEMARAHVELALSNPEAFKKVYEKHAARLEEERELEELNRGFENIGESGPEIEIDAASGAIIEKETEDASVTNDTPVDKPKRRGRKPNVKLNKTEVIDDDIFS